MAREKGPVDLFQPRTRAHACARKVSMQQTANAADHRMGAKLTATDTRGLLGRGPDAPAPGGRVGRGQICFGQI